MTALTMVCGEVARALQFVRRNGEPNRQLVLKLARERKIPSPVDMDLPVPYWRWSRAEVEAYAAGTWTPDRRAS